MSREHDPAPPPVEGIQIQAEGDVALNAGRDVVGVLQQHHVHVGIGPAVAVAVVLMVAVVAWLLRADTPMRGDQATLIVRGRLDGFPRSCRLAIVAPPDCRTDTTCDAAEFALTLRGACIRDAIALSIEQDGVHTFAARPTRLFEAVTQGVRVDWRGPPDAPERPPATKSSLGDSAVVRVTIALADISPRTRATWQASAAGIPDGHGRRGTAFSDGERVVLVRDGAAGRRDVVVFGRQPPPAGSAQWSVLTVEQASDALLALDLAHEGLGLAASLLPEARALRARARRGYLTQVQAARARAPRLERARDVCTALREARGLVAAARELGLGDPDFDAEMTAITTMRRQSGCDRNEP